MKKRADLMVLWFIIDLLLGIMLAVATANVTIVYSKGTIYEKQNIAKDLAMQMNAFISMPGDAYFINKNIHGYSVHFSGNKIEVYSEILEPTKGTYFYPATENWNLDVRLEKSKQIVISKINGEIKISEDVPNFVSK